MPGASGTTAAREPRIRAAAASLALAYLRLLGEGDGVRASLVLGAFQTFYNANQAVIQGAWSTPLPASLRVTGALNAWQDELAIYAALDEGGFVPANAASRFNQAWEANGGTVGGAMFFAGWFNQYVRPHVPDSYVYGATGVSAWEPYRRAGAVPPQDAGNVAANWALGWVEGIDDSEGAFNDLIDQLADDQPRDVAPAPSPTEYVHPTDIVVPGITQLRARSTPWGWYLAGGAAALTAFGLLWGIWRKKPRRRRR